MRVASFIPAAFCDYWTILCTDCITEEEMELLKGFTPDPDSIWNLEKQKRHYLAYLPGGIVDQMRARNKEINEQLLKQR